MCVVMDYFSKWPEAKPIRKKNAEEVAQFLYELICRFGCVNIQINDQGREFCNQVASELHGLTGVHQRVTSAYHPQANGLVERANRTIQGGMLKVLQEQQSQWPRVLNGLLFAYRTSRNKSTGITPFEMMFGRKAITPLQCGMEEDNVELQEVEFDLENEEYLVDAEEVQRNLENILQVQALVHEEAERNILKAQARYKKDYEVRHGKKLTFKPGDKVLVWNLRRADRKGDKSKLPWEGPYTVKRNVEGKGLYELLKESGSPLAVKHHGSNLKLFMEREDNSKADEHHDSSHGEPSEPEVSSHSAGSSSPQFLGTAASANNLKFLPTGTRWRAAKCKELGLPAPSTRESPRKVQACSITS